MQQLSDISLWGAVPVLLLFGMAVALLALTDRSFLMRIFQVTVIHVSQMLLLGGCVWLLWRLSCWWADTLWLLLTVTTVAFLLIDKARLNWYKLLLPVTVALLAGLSLPLLALLMSFRQAGAGLWQIFVPLAAVLVGQLYVGASRALQTYTRQLRHTQQHYQYMVANGATHLEALMPSVRRGLKAAVLPLLGQMVKPLLIVVPLLFCGLLLAGAQPVVAVVASLLIVGASLSAQVISSVLMFCLADRFFYDAQDRFIVY